MAVTIIKALLLEPEQHPKTTYLPLSSAVFDAITGADNRDYKTASMKIDDQIYAIYNQDAALQDAAGNRRLKGQILAGNILIVETDPAGHIQSMTDDVLLKYKSKFWHPETYSSHEVCRSYFNSFYHSL